MALSANLRAEARSDQLQEVLLGDVVGLTQGACLLGGLLKHKEGIQGENLAFKAGGKGAVRAASVWHEADKSLRGPQKSETGADINCYI